MIIYICIALIIFLSFIIIELVNRKYNFVILLTALYVSQLFILKPGSDASAVSGSNYNTYTIFGFTFSALICIALAIYCFMNVFHKNNSANKFNASDFFLILGCFVFFTIGIMCSPSLSDAIDLSTKMIMPFIIYFYMRFSVTAKDSNLMHNCILVINIITVAQVVVCKILTGQFSASRYYWYIMTQEFFGYYNSPHPFAALLGLMAIWNIKCINERRHTFLNSILFVINFILIFLSGVRTYALAATISCAFLIICALFSKQLKRFKPIAVTIVAVTLIFSGVILQFFLTSRLNASYNTTDLTSGRISRWTTDLQYFVGQTDIVKILFGNGFKQIYTINSSLIGVYINSLNVFIDLLVENGIFGTILLCALYSFIWIRFYHKESRYFNLAIGVFLAIGLFVNNLLPYVTIMPMSVIFLTLLDVDYNATAIPKKIAAFHYPKLLSETRKSD